MTFRIPGHLDLLGEYAAHGIIASGRHIKPEPEQSLLPEPLIDREILQTHVARTAVGQRAGSSHRAGIPLPDWFSDHEIGIVFSHLDEIRREMVAGLNANPLGIQRVFSLA